jgi:hypothetical protein
MPRYDHEPCALGRRPRPLLELVENTSRLCGSACDFNSLATSRSRAGVGRRSEQWKEFEEALGETNQTYSKC